MSIEPFDWFNRFFGRTSWPFSRRDSLFGGFDDITREMEQEFEDIFRDLENKVPKELVKEYETEDRRKVRQIGPLVYGSTTTIGPDGKPVVREFGNMRPSQRRGFTKPTILSERQPLSEVYSRDKEVVVTVELPGVSKENIKLNAYDNKVEVTTDDAKRKYHEIVDLPTGVDVKSVRSTFKNGLLEITFNRTAGKNKGKSVKID
ncbi:MAG TPA: archaeal heat shock protein Hsp20 [Nitrososphaeraceae archaeon]|nr:archaeal heat shock protein Hsp20 [Nitrososphaeraceae archaeon]